MGENTDKSEALESLCECRELKWGPFVLWHRLTRGHWFVPLSDLVSDYCQVCLKSAYDHATEIHRG